MLVYNPYLLQNRGLGHHTPPHTKSTIQTKTQPQTFEPSYFTSQPIFPSEPDFTCRITPRVNPSTNPTYILHLRPKSQTTSTNHGCGIWKVGKVGINRMIAKMWRFWEMVWFCVCTCEVYVDFSGKRLLVVIGAGEQSEYFNGRYRFVSGKEGLYQYHTDLSSPWNLIHGSPVPTPKTLRTQDTHGNNQVHRSPNSHIPPPRALNNTLRIPIEPQHPHRDSNPRPKDQKTKIIHSLTLCNE